MEWVTVLGWVASLAGALAGGLLLGRMIARRSQRRDLARWRNHLLDPSSVTPSERGVWPQELRDVADALDEMRASRRAEDRGRYAEEATARLQRAMARLAHDIRSPLAAVEVFLGSGRISKETHEQILKPALARLRSIAGLLTDERLAGEILDSAEPESGVISSASGEDPQPILLSAMLDAVASSLRMQAPPGPHDRIEWDEASAPYGLFVHLPPRTLRSWLEELAQTLLTPGLLAGEPRLRLVVSIVRESESVVFRLEVPAAPIGPRATGAAGSTRIESLVAEPVARLRRLLGSSGRVVADLSDGTAIEITIPIATPPSWFLAELRLPHNQAVLVVDDDPWVHHMWERIIHASASARAKSTGETFPHGGAAGGPEVIHLTSLDEFESRLAQTGFRDRVGLFLVDDNYRGSDRSGLDLLERFPEIVSRAVLVTGRWEEGQVRARSVALGLRLLPKHLAPRIPRASDAGSDPSRLEERPDAVLVDDHVWIRKGWELSAARSGRRLRTCASMQEFQALQPHLDRATVLFIDSDLCDEMPGERFAWSLFDAGFTTIYLATGFDPDHFHPMPWLRGIIGKDPPDWLRLGETEEDPLASLAGSEPARGTDA